MAKEVTPAAMRAAEKITYEMVSDFNGATKEQVVAEIAAIIDDAGMRESREALRGITKVADGPAYGIARRALEQLDTPQ